MRLLEMVKLAIRSCVSNSIIMLLWYHVFYSLMRMLKTPPDTEHFVSIFFLASMSV